MKKDITVAEIKAMLATLDEKTAAADRAERLYSRDPMDATAESAFDRAYAEQWRVYMDLCKAVSEFAGLTLRDARNVVNEREQLRRILSRSAE